MKRYMIAMDLIRSGCLIRKPDRDGVSPLHYAAQNEDFVAVKLLLDCDLHQNDLQYPNPCIIRPHISTRMRSFISDYK